MDFRSTSFSESRFGREIKAGRVWSVGGVLLGLALGIALAAPASWLASALSQVTNGRLLLAEARGTVWDGSAVAVLTGGPGSRDASALPGRLHWTLRPNWRGVQLALRQPCCIADVLNLQLTPSLSGIGLALQGHGAVAASPAGSAAAQAALPLAGVDDHLAQWPAAWLSGLGAPFNTLGLAGTLQLASPGFSAQSVQGRWQLDGSLRFDLLDASSTVAPLPVLGSYRLQMDSSRSTGESAKLTLQTTSGALLLDGNGQWTGGRLRFRGEAKAAPGQEATLNNLLSLIGRRQGALAIISIG